MRTIKFRGKRLDNGELIYGDILHYGKYETCIRSYLFPDKNSFSTLPVDPESVAQLIGFDKNGEEIYSDDKIRVYDYGVEPKIWDAGDFFNVSEIGEEFDFIELLEEAEKNDEVQ